MSRPPGGEKRQAIQNKNKTYKKQQKTKQLLGTHIAVRVVYCFLQQAALIGQHHTHRSRHFAEEHNNSDAARGCNNTHHTDGAAKKKSKNRRRSTSKPYRSHHALLPPRLLCTQQCHASIIRWELGWGFDADWRTERALKGPQSRLYYYSNCLFRVTRWQVQVVQEKTVTRGHPNFEKRIKKMNLFAVCWWCFSSFPCFLRCCCRQFYCVTHTNDAINGMYVWCWSSSCPLREGVMSAAFVSRVCSRVDRGAWLAGARWSSVLLAPLRV